MPEPKNFTDQELVDYLDNELSKMLRSYPDRIRAGELSKRQANKEYCMIKLILDIIAEAHRKNINLRGLLLTLKSINTASLNKSIQSKLKLK